MLAPTKHILPVTTIQRERMLPVPGRVLVRKGQKVSPGDIVADANAAPEHLLLDIARGLGLPAVEADRYIRHQAGDELSEGDVVAGPVGLARRVVRTPYNGKVVVAGSGQVLLELEGKPFELKAGFPGVVAELYLERGILIETVGALLQGVWGNGGLDYGLLTILLQSPEDKLTSDRLDVSMRGSVVVGGYCEDAQVLSTAVDLPVRGMILASMSAKLIPFAQKVGYPLIVLEGFGKLPMGKAAYKLLSTSGRREAALMAQPWNRYSGSRPEIVMQLPVNESYPIAPETAVFQPGQQVRMVRAPYHGSNGILERVLPGYTLMPGGLRLPAGQVRLENDKTIEVPLVNLEVLG